MKKTILLMVLVAMLQQVQAQDPITLIIKEGIKKVIVAVDLKIQRLQNKTIWLQNAQKAVENKMSALQLVEISGWVEKQRKLYADYFDELNRVKSVIITWHKVKDIIDQQVQLVNEYKSAWNVFHIDQNFTPAEMASMEKIYGGIMDESLKNIDQLFLVVNAFVTEMSDGARLEIIASVADKLDRQLNDLRRYNRQNKMISLQRASEKGETELVKRIYGF